jgi:hypothetical protein
MRYQENVENTVGMYSFVILPNRVECSTFSKSRVAKASKGPIPPPFLITFQVLNELRCKVTALKTEKQKKSRYFSYLRLFCKICNRRLNHHPSRDFNALRIDPFCIIGA